MSETIPASKFSVVGVLRVLAGSVALIPTAFALLVAHVMVGDGYNPVGGIFVGVAGTVAVFCWWIAFWGQVEQSRVRMGVSFLGGILFGGIGLVGGSVITMLLNPDGNLGPMLAIFFIGPCGFIFGLFLGWLFARFGLGRSAVLAN